MLYIKQIENTEKVSVSAEKLRQRAERYNRELALVKEYREKGKVLIISPDDTCGVDTLTRGQKALMRFYEKGFQDVNAID